MWHKIFGIPSAPGILSWKSGLFFVALLSGLLPGSELRAQKIGVETLRTQRIPYLLPLQGQLQPVRSIKHFPAVEGEIQQVYVKSGQKVAKGARLFSVLPSALQGKTFRINIAYARISGTVSKLRVQPQQNVTTGDEALRITDQSSFLLNTYISDMDFPQITNRTHFHIHLDGERSNMEADNLSRGRLWQLDSIPNEQGLFPLSIVFAPNEALYAGRFVIASAQAGFEEGLYVLIEAIVRRHGNNYIWLLDQENRISLQAVTLGQRLKDSQRITKGLSDGDRYVSQLNGAILGEGQQLNTGQFEELSE